ncbi:uncharacterized protein LOC121417068 [Lytechinus variegatus]|uniref:uncharacterized protein LOC121417068 n=1 Tax=Lytechinus variegatus TaxID=7654 RepID=UPI001BB2113C|nr:uncharacterized protein LOC121417068 [Lytechinus variegatus]
MGFRRRFIGFTGAIQILLTLVMFIMTSQLPGFSTVQITNNAVGTPLWGGIILLMCGAGNIIDALESPSKKRSPQQDYNMLPLNFTTLLANLTAFVVSALILGLFSWSLSTVVTLVVVHFSTVIVAASLICIFSLFALFADCFGVCFAPPPHHQRPYYVDYDGPPRGMPNQVFKA